MWKAVDFDFHEDLFFESIAIENLKTVILVSNETGKRQYRILFDGVPLSYRVTQEAYDWCPFENYENNDGLDFRANKIFYAQESEYLNWFFTVNDKQNEQILGSDKDLLYHFQIITVDTVVDLISDDFPTVERVG